MKYILFLVAIGCGFSISLNAQHNETANPNLNSDRAIITPKQPPVPMPKGRHEEMSKTIVQKAIPMCFEKDAYSFLTNNQECMITNNEMVQTKLTKITFFKDGKHISGWKIDSNKDPKIKDYIWLDYSADSFAKNLGDSRVACNRKGAELPSYEDLSAAADSGFFRVSRLTEFKVETDAQIKKIRIRSNSLDETRQNSLSRKMDYDEKDKDGPLAKVSAANKGGNNYKTGMDISFCVIKKLNP